MSETKILPRYIIKTLYKLTAITTTTRTVVEQQVSKQPINGSSVFRLLLGKTSV